MPGTEHVVVQSQPRSRQVPTQHGNERRFICVVINGEGRDEIATTGEPETVGSVRALARPPRITHDVTESQLPECAMASTEKVRHAVDVIGFDTEIQDLECRESRDVEHGQVA